MGTDKALVCFEGLPMLVRVFRAAQVLNAPIAVVTSWPERYTSLELPGVTFIVETAVAHGPICGLICGLEHIASEWVLLLACDMPRLDGFALATWTHMLAEIPNEILALAPYYDNQWEPLCAFYRRRCLDSLKSYLNTGRKSLYQWFAENSTRAITVSNRNMFFNCNRPEDVIPDHK